MPILCFGGSFNPIHNGHIVCAQVVAGKGAYERVKLIPNSQPPHKRDITDVAPAADRLRMCQLAAEYANSAQPQAVPLEVDDLEMRRSGPSYTLDTARELKTCGVDPVYWLIGADMLMYLPKWHKPLELLREVHFVVMARPGFEMDWSALPEAFRQLKSHVVEAPLVDVSATEIRDRVRRREPIEHLTPPPVAQYISTRSLYLR
jgi:nicotinate-nucleotide adenylyltransferase